MQLGQHGCSDLVGLDLGVGVQPDLLRVGDHHPADMREEHLDSRRSMPRFQRSTGVCPDCGLIDPKLPLSVREWARDGCGVVHDRHVAAAKAICLGAAGRAPPEPASAKRRQRGLADQGGDLARAGSSLDGSPANIHHPIAAACGLPDAGEWVRTQIRPPAENHQKREDFRVVDGRPAFRSKRRLVTYDRPSRYCDDPLNQLS